MDSISPPEFECMSSDECKQFFAFIFDFNLSSKSDKIAYNRIIKSLGGFMNDLLPKDDIIMFFVDASFL